MEYQYYEFHSLDKSLSSSDRKEISSWSSRTEATATSAIFTYSYSDFPKDEFRAVEQYFDMMLYIANWGTKRLILKIPTHLVDFNQIKLFDCSNDDHYCESELLIHKKGKYVFLDFKENNEEGYIEWIEEGSLVPLLSIRDNIINGDYRILYLFWLHSISKRTQYLEEYEGITDIYEIKEPPVPYNLKNATGNIQSFIDFWEIDSSWIEAASKMSKSRNEKKLDLKSSIKSLSEAEKNDYLLRLAKGEIRLHQTFLKCLKSKEGISNPSSKTQNRIPVTKLVKIVKQINEQKKALAKAKAESKKKEKIDEIAKEQTQHWKSVKYNVSQGNSRSYDLAIETLKDLLELAQFQNDVPKFKTKLEEIKAEFSRKSSFIRRVKNKFDHL